MSFSSSIILLLVIANLIVSYKGFTSEAFMSAYSFHIESVLVKKEYFRMISAGFLHVDWKHLIFNMLTIYFFGTYLLDYAGPLLFLIIYFASMIGGKFFSLFVHRNHPDYHAVGASGAACGIMYAFIAIYPTAIVMFFLPAWIYGIGYVLYTIYGIKTKKGDVAHEGHLGGALVGLLIFVLFHPTVFVEHYFVILVIAIPSIAFIVYTIKHPEHLIIGGFGRKTDPIKTYSIDQKYNLEKSQQQKELDRILDKINDRGLESLSKKEKEHLKRFS